jgi:hypothetical protein
MTDVKWTDVVQVLVGIVGIPFIIYQLYEVRRSIQGQTLGELYEHYHRVVTVFVERPHLRPYFYENKPIDESTSSDHREEIESMCDLFAAVLEHALVQQKNVPRRAWKECWETFVAERHRKSPELQRYLKENGTWYLQDLCALKTNQPRRRGRRGDAKAQS